MSSRSASNEIVLALTRALRAALDAGAADRSGPTARDVAQVLGLDGLDRCLLAYELAPSPAAAETIRDLCARAEATASLQPFIDADAELGHGAGEPGHAGTPSGGTLGAREALDDLPLADDVSRDVASRVRLDAHVTAALRAALDWLHQGEAHRPVTLRLEDATLIVRCPRVNPGGLAAATAVLAAVEGNLGPDVSAPRGGGSGWMIRVPIAVARPTYLMLSQGDLELALPWHAVLRLAMMPGRTFAPGTRSLGYPLLEPLAPLDEAAEYPIVLVAHGLRRAYLVADRLVWRLPAVPGEARHDARLPGYDRTVQT